MKNRFLSLLLLTVGMAQAQNQPFLAAGTVISNQVVGEAVLPTGPLRSLSNIVTTVVNPVCNVSVTPNGTAAAPAYSQTVLPGESTTFRYVVRNVGNDTFTFPLSTQNVGGNTAQLSLFQDSNNNGSFDYSDAAIDGLTLAAGQSATVWLKAAASSEQGGQALVNLVAQCSGADGSHTSDSDNISRLVIGQPPILNLSKTFSVSTLRPGDSTDVTVTLSNTGASGSREVVLTDSLTTQVLQGLLYERGSAKTTTGTLEYSSDNVNWSTTEPDGVEGLRVRLSSLDAAGEVKLTFRMKADASAEGRSFTNVAHLTTSVGAQNIDASAALQVRYRPAVAIGPVGAPEAAGAADTQTVAFALTGKETCFDHTVKNTGDVSDNFNVTVTPTSGSANTVVRGPGGNVLSQPIALAPQATSTVQVCYVPTATQGGGSLNATVTVKGERGTSDTTTDNISRIETRLPGLVKTVSKPDDSNWKSGDRVSNGDLLDYTLTVTNPYSAPLTGVQVSDPLPTDLEVVGSTAGAAASTGNALTWTLDSLGAGESRTFTIHTRVGSSSKDDEEISNTFNLTTKEIPAALSSNAVTAYVWNTVPLIKKVPNATDVTFGDKLGYTLTLQNVSSTSAMTHVTVTDTPAKGLEYVPGSSKLDGQPLADPTISGGNMVWAVDRIETSSQRLLTYDMRVTPEATGELVNSVVMEGYGASGKSRAVASSRARAMVHLKLLNFAPQADILGTVFVDSDGNGKVGQDDLPLSGARVILAGGRISQTDARGRFHFGNVALGTQALRLDLASVPYQPEAGSPATRTVNVGGLTSVNFALQPNAGTVGRSVSFKRADQSLVKTVSRVPGGYQVRLDVHSPAAQSAFELQDSLPAGAKLQSGAATYTGPLAAGQTTFTYTYKLPDPTAGAANTIPAELLKAPAGWGQ